MTSPGKTIWREDFAGGLDLDERWVQMTAGGFSADDGIARTDPDGLHVESAGTNPDTNQPAFTKELDGILDHLKWFVQGRQLFETGGGPLRVTFRANAKGFGMAGHPYGAAVTDPSADMRLGALVLNVMDAETGMVFDFWVCDTGIYPYYERIIVAGSDSEAFGSTRSPHARQPSDLHDFSLEINAAAGTAVWEVDGTRIGEVDQIGLPNDAWTTVVDHGGHRQTSSPAQLSVGIGMFTLLDGSLSPAQEGLVDLGMHYECPKTFVGGPHLFGQGVEGRIHHIEVTQA